MGDTPEMREMSVAGQRYPAVLSVIRDRVPVAKVTRSGGIRQFSECPLGLFEVGFCDRNQLAEAGRTKSVPNLVDRVNDEMVDTVALLATNVFGHVFLSVSAVDPLLHVWLFGAEAR